MHFNTKYPTVEDLRKKAKKRIPKFAFEYLDGGCNSDVNLKKNTNDIRKIEFVPLYLSQLQNISLNKSVLGLDYNAPFGISPVGLQGLMWPNTPEILAKAAHDYNIPFVLSTVTTSSIESIGKITDGRFWFQLYHPADNNLRDDILKRASNAGCEVLVLLCDVPSFGFRPKDIRNGLAMPPKMSLNNLLQILSKPNWAFETLRYGQPNFETLTPYMPKNMNLNALGKFMDETFQGKLWEEKIKAIRDKWNGKIVLKGVASHRDTEIAINCGLDGIIVSNHGGRQLDAGESSIHALQSIVSKYKDQITIMMDSGIRTGPDIACTLASGAEFTFLGRAFMYGVSALGNKGGNHTIEMLKIQLTQIMEQIGCKKSTELNRFLKQ